MTAETDITKFKPSESLVGTASLYQIDDVQFFIVAPSKIALKLAEEKIGMAGFDENNCATVRLYNGCQTHYIFTK